MSDSGTPQARLSREKALSAMAALCARSEQCEYDLRRKMQSRGVSQADADAVIEYLYENRFLDTDRYAGAYVRDKLRHSRRGRIKLRLMLGAKHIPSHAVKKALATIDETEYADILASLVETASRTYDPASSDGRAHIMRRLYARGFEPGLISSAISEWRSSHS